MELQLGKSRFYELYSDYLRACAQGQAQLWIPGCSGGDHQPDWPAGVAELLRKRLTSKPPCWEIYVDFHSIFFSHSSSTQLGDALRFYGISFRYAPTPQAKGKIERDHQTWQNRLPPLFASEQITDLHQANQLIISLLDHRNLHENHRELRMTPKCAWDKAQTENRSALRPVPTCPWWPFVWSQRSGIQVGPDKRINIGTVSVRVDASPGTWLILCNHTSGHHSVIQHHPKPRTKPVIIFSNLPK